MKEEILSLLKDCADLVQNELKTYDKGRFQEDMGMGADGTPTKWIDKQAEETAIRFLQNNSDYSILSEEEGIIKGKKDGTIVIDPIDGTRNAILDIPFYCISLAYAEDDLSGTTVGYVRNLATGKEYSAIKGKGSFSGKREIKPVIREDWIFSVYMGENAHPNSAKVASIPRRTRSLGSAALEICMVADGIFDLHHHWTLDQKRSLRITDIAAAVLILREAGGEVYDRNNNPLNMRLDPTERKDVTAIYDKDILEVIK